MAITLASAIVTVISLGLYILLDGFDLGVGAIMLISPDPEQRDRLAQSIEPTWDGNETWLIMAGVSLLAAFPSAYAILLPALYIPLIAMLIALGFRAVAFDFRRQDGPMQMFWDRAFSLGSIAAALAQGAVLGTLIQGITVRDGAFAGSPLDVFQVLPGLCAIDVLCGYIVLGGAWALWRLPSRDRPLLVKHLRRGIASAATLAALTIGYAAVDQPSLALRWEASPAVSAGGALATVAILIVAWRSIGRDGDLKPFLWALTGAILVLTEIVESLLPDVVPFRVSWWQAAAPPNSQKFYLMGAVIVIPLILGYTAFAYWTFRGKVVGEARLP